MAFESGGLSNRAVARKFGVSESAVRARAKAEKWSRAPAPHPAPQNAHAAHCAIEPVEPTALTEQARAILGRLLDELELTTRHRDQIQRLIAEATGEDGDGGRRSRSLLKLL